MYKGFWSLLGDNVKDNEELDTAAYRILKERTGMNDVYLDQVRAFSHPKRHPGGRVITLAYCSLLNIQHHELLQTITRYGTLKEATDAAAELAVPGEVVLLAPGGTSFDEFVDFEDRGNKFKEWVNALK